MTPPEIAQEATWHIEAEFLKPLLILSERAVFRDSRVVEASKYFETEDGNTLWVCGPWLSSVPSMKS